MNEFVGYIDDQGRVFDGTFDYEGHVGPIGPQGEPGYTPQRGVDYWTDEDKAYVVAEATSLINGKIEEYNANATAKTNAFNSNASDKTTAFNNNASDKTTAFNSNATSKTSDYNDNATSKTNTFNAHVAQAFNELTGRFYLKTQTYNKDQIDAKIASTYHYKGSVTDYTELPSSGQQVGDVYNIENAGGGYNAGDNVAWTGTAWDILAGTVDLTNYYTKSEADTLLGGKQNEIDSSNKLASDLVDDTNQTNKFVTEEDKTNWNGKEDAEDAEEKYAELKAENEQLLDQIPTATATGNPINVQDSSNLPIKDFALGGNATQDGTPTPDSPQDIHVVTGDNTVKVLGSNYFNASAIANTNIVVSNGGQKITMPIATSGNGIAATYSKLKELCPELRAGDQVRLNFTRTPSGNNNFIYLNGTGQTWSNGSLGTITEENLESLVSLYGNRYNAGETAQVTLTDFRITRTNTEPYVPYRAPQTQLLSLGQIELAKIGTYTDRIFKDSGKWYVEKNIGEVTLDENTTLSVRPDVSTVNTICFRGGLGDLNDTFVANTVQLSDKFVCLNDTSDTEHLRYTGASNYRVQLFINKSRLATLDLEGLQTWLGNNNVLIKYVLSTPTTTEITDTTLIGQLESMLEKTTYKNTTNFWSIVASGNCEGELEVEYRQDLDTLTSRLDNLEARVTLLET